MQGKSVSKWRTATSKFVCLMVLILGMSKLGVSNLYAQGGTGSIQGVVLDSRGLAVPGAAVAVAAVGSVSVVATGTVKRAPTTTSTGLEVEKTFTIKESGPVAGDIREWELDIDGKVVWTGMGDTRADALLNAILFAVGEADDLPDN